MVNCSNNNKKLMVAIETSGRIGSVAAGCGDNVLAKSTFSGFMKHSTELFPHIQKLLTDIDACPADIRQLAITAGPGSFTGLRIAVTVAKMMNFAHNTQIIAADTMDVLAENAVEYNKQAVNEPIDCVATILDAKRNLFYAAAFEQTGDEWSRILPTGLLKADELLERLKGRRKVAFLGEGLQYYAEKFTTPFSIILDKTRWSADAAGLYRVGQKMAQKGLYADAKTLTPFYIRPPEAVENWEKRNKPSA